MIQRPLRLQGFVPKRDPAIKYFGSKLVDGMKYLGGAVSSQDADVKMESELEPKFWYQLKKTVKCRTDTGCH